MLLCSSANHKNKPELDWYSDIKVFEPTDISTYLEVGFYNVESRNDFSIITNSVYCFKSLKVGFEKNSKKAHFTSIFKK